MYLLNPIVVRLRQEQVLLAYPFHYLSAVNAKATEIIVNYENRKNFTGCDDTSLINPTCGLKHERGKAVPFSEGFCCFCPETPVNEKQPRGGQDCSLKVEGDPNDLEKQKYKASAHCLHFSDIWYSVSAVNEPFILHEAFLQVYIENHFKNGSSAWFALTHDEDFELSPQNTYQYNDNKTIVISYLTGIPKTKAITVPLSERRLLTPQPMPAVELSKLPTPVINGAADYLLLPKDVIDPGGDECDVAGVSYTAFALQPDRCSVPKDTKHAQISKITSSVVKKSINIRASILNSGLIAAKFTIEAVKCAYDVPDSSKESVIIPPQMTEDVLIITKSVQVSSELYGVVAKREVAIHPRARCICNFHCECACMSDSLKCELMSEEDYQGAGFRGSLPILTAKPPYRIWILAHPFLALLALFLFMLLIGLIKSICGIMGWSAIGNFGMDKVFYRPRKIKKYPQSNLKHLEVVYDDEGYPIHPDTRERIKAVSDLLLPFFNLVFMFFWPCMMCQKCYKKTAKLKRKWTKEKGDDDSKDTRGEKGKDSLKSPAKKPGVFKRIFGKKGKDSTEQKIPTQNIAVKKSKSDDATVKSQPFRPKHSVSVSKSEETPSTGPAADPLNKERQRWQKGKTIVGAVTGK